MLDKTTFEAELEKLEDGAGKVTVTVSAEEVDKQIAAAYKDLSHKYRIPGFRPGRAPRKVIDNHLGKDAAHATATENYLSETYLAAVDSCGVISLSEPRVDADELFKDGEAYTYTIDVTLQPELELENYDAVDVFMPPEEATDAEINAQIEILRGYQYEFEEIEGRPVEADDYTILDMKATRDGETVDLWTNDERYYQLGKGFLPEAFDKELIGMNIGDSKSFTVTAEDGMEDGDTDFEVTIAKIRKKKFAEVDDEFAKNCGADSLEDLKKSLAEDIESEKKASRPRLLEQRCAEELATRLTGEPRDEYVAGVRTDMVQQLYAQLSANGVPLDFYLQQIGMTVEEFTADLDKRSAAQARDFLAFDALAKHLGIEISDEDVEKEFSAAAQQNGRTVEDIREQFETEGRMTGLISAMRRSKAAEWLTENANVTIRETPDEDEDAGTSEQDKAEEIAHEVMTLVDAKDAEKMVAEGDAKEKLDAALAEEAPAEEAPAEE